MDGILPMKMNPLQIPEVLPTFIDEDYVSTLLQSFCTK